MTRQKVIRGVEESEHGAETRRRLLEAAGEIFAVAGLKNATVRQICAAADANIAAINYHFGGKEELYHAALDFWIQREMTKYPPDMGVKPGDPPEQRLHAFVLSFLHRILDEDKPAWHGKLMMREILDPSRFLEERIERIFKPMLELLRGIVIELLGRRPPARHLQQIECSILGQLTFYHSARAVIDRVMPEQQFSKPEIERIARHITDFTLSALSALAGRGEEDESKGRSAAR